MNRYQWVGKDGIHFAARRDFGLLSSYDGLEFEGADIDLHEGEVTKEILRLAEENERLVLAFGQIGLKILAEIEKTGTSGVKYGLGLALDIYRECHAKFTKTT